MYTLGQLDLNQWGLSGQWVVGGESAVTADAGAGIAYQFKARDLHLVADRAPPAARAASKSRSMAARPAPTMAPISMPTATA
jgi:hypothetical protein